MLRRALLAAALFVSGLSPTVALAQSEPILIEPVISPDYRRGRNVSVTERPRPEYDALGIRTGSFLLYPRLSTGVGATSNAFLSITDPEADVFLSVAPSITARSDWSRHQLLGAAGIEYRPYLSNARRDEFGYYANVLSRMDIGSNWAITGELQTARVYEAPFSGEVDAEIAALSSYQRYTTAARAQYTSGRLRLTGALDFNAFDFNDIELLSGALLNQEDRDRDIARAGLQAEYALSPSLVLYSHGTIADTQYERPLIGGGANRDSLSYRWIVGASLDLSGFFRGNVGIGYTARNYDAPTYEDVDGISAEARIEYFPSRLTTVTLNLRRLLEDSSFTGLGAYFDNRASIRVDHELRYNFLLNAVASYANQDYAGSVRENDVYQVRGGGRYLVSRAVSLRFDVAYTGRNQNLGPGIAAGHLDEVRGEIGLIYQR